MAKHPVRRHFWHHGNMAEGGKRALGWAAWHREQDNAARFCHGDQRKPPQIHSDASKSVGK